MGKMSALFGWGHPHRQPEAIPAEGIGPDGYGAGVIRANRPFPTRGAVLHHGDDQVVARPARKSHAGHIGLQLNNGRSGVSRTGRVTPMTPLLIQQARPVPSRVLPGDRVYVPPSPSQVQGWTKAGAGSIPKKVTGNGSLAPADMAQLATHQGGSY